MDAWLGAVGFQSWGLAESSRSLACLSGLIHVRFAFQQICKSGIAHVEQVSRSLHLRLDLRSVRLAVVSKISLVQVCAVFLRGMHAKCRKMNMTRRCFRSTKHSVRIGTPSRRSIEKGFRYTGHLNRLPASNASPAWRSNDSIPEFNPPKTPQS